MNGALAWTLAALLLLPPQLYAQVAGPNVWRSFAETIAPGKVVKVRLRTGERFKATLLQVSPDGLTVQPKTRAAVPPQRVPFDQIETLELDHGKGIGVGKAVAIGAG